MRTNETLVKGFENIKILQQYLYMDESHNITIESTIGVKLEITMDENLCYYCKNLNFPEVSLVCWNNEMSNETMLAIIDQLQETQSVESLFKSRWDEIRNITMASVSIASARQEIMDMVSYRMEDFEED